jgi:hypothetical protein
MKIGCVREPTVSQLTQQLNRMQQLCLPKETLINNIQNYNLYVLSAINGLQKTTVLRELCISKLFFILKI